MSADSKMGKLCYILVTEYFKAVVLTANLAHSLYL